MTSTALAGTTGLVGSHILTTLLAHPSITAVQAFTRRALPTSNETRLHPILIADTLLWPSLFPRTPAPTIFLSALGTTRAAAGSVEAQRKIDVDLNYALAQAAKDAGVDTYVLISSNGASASSSMAYPRMKGELEDKVKALGFKHTVILRPGVLIGPRGERRLAEGIMQGLAGVLGKVNRGLKDGWAQDADVIARAAVVAGMRCVEGKREEGVWVVGQKEILLLGRGGE